LLGFAPVMLQTLDIGPLLEKSAKMPFSGGGVK
jgi:hypothetical protein